MDDIDYKLMLYLSVDVIGSTAFKQKQINKDEIHQWLLFFLEFYDKFPVTFNSCCLNVQKSEPDHFKFEDPALWKSLGDELIFTVELKHSKRAFFYIQAFRDAVIAYRKYIEFEQKLPLSLKATAWIAGFPVINAKIKSEIQVELVDYIGPLIDIGFRLSKNLSKRKFVISIDLALLLLEHRESDIIKFHYEGRTDLKGIQLDEGYPLLWIDMCEDNDYHRNEDLLLSPRINNSSLKDFCRSFLENENGPFIIPFINYPDERKFNVKPVGFEERFIRMKEFLEQHSQGHDPKTPSTLDFSSIIEKYIPQ